jgi:hypothetical protein
MTRDLMIFTVVAFAVLLLVKEQEAQEGAPEV